MIALSNPTCAAVEKPAATALNLLTNECTVEEIAAVLACHPRKPLQPVLGSEAWQRAARNPLLANLAAPGCDLADRDWAEPLPPLTDELYTHFRRSGIRMNFEEVYFERRRGLARAAIRLLLAGKDDPKRGRMKVSLLDKLESVFEEESWALPAHVNWDNDDVSGKDPMQIDLFCAETANVMAEMLDVFGEIIPEPLAARIRERLQVAIFDNYLRRDFHWMEVTHNWNAVCHQGVVGAALSQIDDPRKLAEILFRMKSKLPDFLSGFAADGGCSEGPGYWAYGFGRFALLNEQLESRTGGELSLFAGDDRIPAIARYGARMKLAGGLVVNFSDCRATGGFNPPLLSYLGERLDDPECRAAGEDEYRQLIANGIPWNDERAAFFELTRLFLGFPAAPSGRTAVAEDCYYPDLAVVVARGKDARGHLWEFAAKGGHNDEHHNHNDCGGFILNIDGQRIVMEIGKPEYVHDYFGAKRYEFLAARSLGHSVPWINGFEQAPGREYAARMISVKMDVDPVEVTIDLTKCYPPEARCRRLHRTLRFEKSAGRLTVTDDYELEEPGVVESILICSDDVIIRDHLARIGILSSSPAPGTHLAKAEFDSYKTRKGAIARIGRLRFSTDGGAVAEGSIRYFLTMTGTC